MYGILVTVSICAAAFYAEHIAKKDGKSIDLLWGGLFWALVFGLIGARLYHVLDYWETYSQNPIQIFLVWRGGVGIYGGLFAGFVSFTTYLKIKKQNIAEWLDIAGLVIPLAQSIGRWGNYFNGELLPYALYESTATILFFLLLLKLWKYLKTYPGAIFYSYLIGYGFVRLILEPVKIQSWSLGQFNVAQTISAVIIIFGTLGLLKIYANNQNKK